MLLAGDIALAEDLKAYTMRHIAARVRGAAPIPDHRSSHRVAPHKTTSSEVPGEHPCRAPIPAERRRITKATVTIYLLGMVSLSLLANLFLRDRSGIPLGLEHEAAQRAPSAAP